MKEYMVVIEHDRKSHELNPYDGLQDTLNKLAAEGWELVVFDWASWRRAVFAREVPEVAGG